MKRLEDLVDAAMKDGAVGFSTGLLYVPGAYAETAEVIELAKAAAARGGGFARGTHGSPTRSDVSPRDGRGRELKISVGALWTVDRVDQVDCSRGSGDSHLGP